MQPYLQVRETDDGLVLHGELDLGSVDILREALAALERPVVTVDLSQLTFIDSSGLKALVDIKKTHAATQIVNPTRETLRVLDLAGLTPILLGRQDDTASSDVRSG